LDDHTLAADKNSFEKTLIHGILLFISLPRKVRKMLHLGDQEERFPFKGFVK
jgi:hypothetical protein